MSSEACCTCATIIRDPASSPQYHLETKIEKQFSDPEDRRLECCSRVICGRCIDNNSRFATYCPYCQLSSSPSNPIPHGLREPPSYDFATSKDAATTAGHNKPSQADTTAPPPYTTSPNRWSSPQSSSLLNEKSYADEKEQHQQPPPDTLHFLHPTDDTVPSLSLRYNVPAPVLRRYNKLTSDHLLSARRTILIPGSHYPSGVSLSPRPVEGEEEEARKAKVRRWMVACKCPDYEIAELYLEQSGHDLNQAVEKYVADEEWEKAHPLEAKAKGKTKARGNAGGTGGVWASQAAFLKRLGSS
ncbi:hypothetical protein M406DRAFT_320425 [Cryphonectria parasitica EP155]|uniref:LysM domain-containing protein n=1 Tax=Cryphonectria parasitica (strain ATCC 38755 / EP155) TaxID=660469 RepID=A0A9P5CTD6_CRYP1|nr:uncharacterized protein M406DRAFT_320425 [Cryphonectria parasitica EP155]KAF3770539.1 hypothetical protein M406DRAFT_320425 [Cryphonectria parasitica EP155]